MPLRFLCPACHQLLSIVMSKAGSEVDCPKCRSTILVPTSQYEEPAANPFDEPGLELALDEIVAATKPAAKSAKTAPPSYSAAAAGLLQSSPGAKRVRAKPAGDDTITISRRTLYLQAALLAIVAVVAFICGYVIGAAK